MERRKQTTARNAAQGGPREGTETTLGEFDSTIQLEQLEREAYTPASLERWSAMQPFLMSCSRRIFRQPLRLVPGSQTADFAAGEQALSARAGASREQLERAASVLVTASPWFGLARATERDAGGADRQSSPSFAPSAVDAGDRGGVVLPMLFTWTRVGAVLAGVASSAAVLVGLWLSTSGSLLWLPSSAPAVSGSSAAAAWLGARSPGTTDKAPQAATLAPRDAQVLGEAAVDRMIGRASEACPLGGIAPASFRLHVNFNPAGQVASATVVGLEGGPSGAVECMRAMVRGARIAPFTGEMITVVRSLRAE